MPPCWIKRSKRLTARRGSVGAVDDREVNDKRNRLAVPVHRVGLDPCVTLRIDHAISHSAQNVANIFTSESARPLVQKSARDVWLTKRHQSNPRQFPVGTRDSHSRCGLRSLRKFRPLPSTTCVLLRRKTCRGVGVEVATGRTLHPGHPRRAFDEFLKKSFTLIVVHCDRVGFGRGQQRAGPTAVQAASTKVATNSVYSSEYGAVVETKGPQHPERSYRPSRQTLVAARTNS